MATRAKRTLGIVSAIILLPVSELIAADSFDQFEPLIGRQIFSVARMDQSVQNAPGAVTVITSEQIERLGIKSIPEALRLVPGFSVDYSSPFTYANRGPNFPTPRRLQVLVDGVSEVYPLVGIVRWETLPIPIERVAKIEVVRSQSAASYGANAFYGTVNIISKHANDTLGSSIHLSGSKRGGSVYARQSSRIGNTSVLMDYKKTKQDRFDEFFDSNMPRHDDMEVDTLSAKTITKNDNRILTFSANAARGEFDHEVSGGEYAVTYPQPELDTIMLFGSYQVDTDTHTIKVEAFKYDRDWDFNWELCGPQMFFYPGLGELYRANPNLVQAALNSTPLPPATAEQLNTLNNIFTGIMSDPQSFSTVCGTQDTSYKTISHIGTVSDVWEATDSMRISTALQFEYRNIESKSFGNGKTTVEKSKLFSNVEYLVGQYLTVNAGVMAESLEYDLSNPEFSPRVGINYHIGQSNTIKAVYSSGKRLIDGIEVIDHNQAIFYLDREIYGVTESSAFTGYFPVLRDKNFVEEIVSREIIYLFNSGNRMFETRYFEEELHNINNYQDASGSPITSYDRKGGEITGGFAIVDFEVRLTGFYTKSISHTNISYDDYDMYGGSIYFLKELENDLDLALAYYGNSSIDQYTSFDRTDIRVSKGLIFSDAKLMFSALVSHHRATYKRAVDYGGELDGGKRDTLNEIHLGLSFSF